MIALIRKTLQMSGDTSNALVTQRMKNALTDAKSAWNAAAPPPSLDPTPRGHAAGAKWWSPPDPGGRDPWDPPTPGRGGTVFQNNPGGFASGFPGQKSPDGFGSAFVGKFPGFGGGTKSGGGGSPGDGPSSTSNAQKKK